MILFQALNITRYTAYNQSSIEISVKFKNDGLARLPKDTGGQYDKSTRYTIEPSPFEAFHETDKHIF